MLDMLGKPFGSMLSPHPGRGQFRNRCTDRRREIAGADLGEIPIWVAYA